MGFLKQSTAQLIRFGPFVDDTDGVTAETALTILQGDMQLSKDGGVFAQKGTAGNATHDADGWYSTTLSIADTATTGILILQINVADALPVWHEYQVLDGAIFDALYADSAVGYLQPTIAGRKLDITATGAAGIDWANIENPASIVDLANTDIALCAVNSDMRGTENANTVIPPTVAQMNARTLLAADYFDPAADTVANVAICAVNSDMKGTNSALLAVNALTAAQVNAEVLDVFTIDTFAEASAVPSATSSILAKINWLFTLGRNKVTQTATTQTVRNDADSSNVATASVSDDLTTFTRNKYS